MESIFLYAVKHTGTHFVQGVLCLHDAISLPIQSGYDFRDGICGHVQNAFIEEKLSVDEFNAIWTSYKIPDRFLMALQNEFTHVGFSLSEKVDIQYRLHVLHYEVLHKTLRWVEGVKVVVPIRDPLLIIVSSRERKDNNIVEIIKGLKYAARLPNVFYFPVDLWAKDKKKSLGLYEFLSLPATDLCKVYLENWPLFGSIGSDFWKQDTQKIMNDLEAEIRILRKSNLEGFYRDLGYKNLWWFR